MLDGIRLSSEVTAVVALGITEDGRKVILDLEIGSSESEEVSKDLVGRLVERGFGPSEGQRLLAVIDGSKPLKNALTNHWPDAVIQRCLVHKERNIRAKLSRKHHGELARLFKQLRVAQGAEQAQAALKALHAFLKAKSAQALASLEEAGDELLAFQLLNVPNTLNITFLSTNNIENAFHNTRRKIRRVTRWRDESTQAASWLAYALGKFLPKHAITLQRSAKSTCDVVLSANACLHPRTIGGVWIAFHIVFEFGDITRVLPPCHYRNERRQIQPLLKGAGLQAAHWRRQRAPTYDLFVSRVQRKEIHQQRVLALRGFIAIE